MGHQTFKKILITSVSVVVILGVAGFFAWYGALRPMHYSHAIVSINNTRIRVDVADTPLSRARGLSDRESLAPDEGMLFVFSDFAVRNFWMNKMRFPLDVLWIENVTVVGMQEHIAPTDEFGAITRFSSGSRADRALELNAGFIRENGVKIGDKAEILTE